MSLKAFLHQLHDDPDKTKPPDWEADWEDAPLPYKLYRGLPVVPLPADMPLTLDGKKASAGTTIHSNVTNLSDLSDPCLLRHIGHWLWYVYGLALVSQTVVEPDPAISDEEMYVQTACRRFVPSGGGLYPNELYVYLKAKDLPPGVYHYDVAHHRLVALREGNFDDYLSKALGDRFDVEACMGVALVSTCFWKNFFKYNNFAYRLQGLDAGVLIGQMLEVSKRFGYAAGVCFQFLDAPLNHLLGLSNQAESVYAVIPLSVNGKMTRVAVESGTGGEERVDALELCRALPEVRHVQYVRSRNVKPFPTVVELNDASRLDSKTGFRRVGEHGNAGGGDSRYDLPDVDRLPFDLAAVCRKRHSPESDYVLSEIPLELLSSLLLETSLSSAYRNDLDGTLEQRLPGVSLYGCFYGVQGIPDGAYRYDGPTHSLRLVREGDHRAWLQQGMSLDNINLFQVPLTFHVAGDRNHLHSDFGYRGYRIQQMEAGMLVQRLLLAAYANGLGGRPLLGFDVNLSDEIYGMAPRGMTSLIQIPVGSYRGRSKLEGSLGS